MPYSSNQNQIDFEIGRLSLLFFWFEKHVCETTRMRTRLTLEKSLPENAPPPCAPHPPYVSTIILRPVRPASPWGPPITKRPLGFKWYTVRSSNRLAGITWLTTCTRRSFLRRSWVTSSSCCVEMTMVWTRKGTQAPLSSLYSTVTWNNRTGVIRKGHLHDFLKFFALLIRLSQYHHWRKKA